MSKVRLVNLSPTIALSDFMKSIKQSTSVWLKGNPAFPLFDSWGREYFAYSVSYTSLENVKRYIAKQEEHHARCGYEEELRTTLEMIGEQWQDYYLT